MYTIDQLSTMSGLTTRTLRTYLKSGFLQGSKETGVWQFTEEQVHDFFVHPSVRPSIEARRNGIVYDFLGGQGQGDAEMCVLLDRRVCEKDAKTYSDCFCRAIREAAEIRYSFIYRAGTAHYILKGREADVRQVLEACDAQI